MQSVAVGNPVNIIFEALPDLTYTGKIVRVEPVLVSVSSTPALQIWASIDTTAYPVTLLGNMNLEVEVVAGEALNALLVPVNALRKLGETQYAVFVVKENGELELRMVDVGLQDLVNAEIRSGLAQGEIVSLGDDSGSSDTVQGNTELNPNMPQFMGEGFGPPGGMP